MMDNREMIKNLQNLIQLDIDAHAAYGQAIKEIDFRAIRSSLEAFREDHKRHVSTLSAVVRDFGGTPPGFQTDFRGFLIEGMTTIRSASGSEGALKAMKTNEKLTNDSYARALKLELPAEVKEIIAANYRDEQRHLGYIEECLASRLWERGQEA